MKHKNVALLIVVAGVAGTFTGCGGGNDPIVTPTSTPTTIATSASTDTQRFAGNYTGAYVAVGSLSGADVSGTFTGTVTSNGSITGNVEQDNGATASGNGTIISSGVVTLSASGSVVVPVANGLSPVVGRATGGPVPRLTTTPVPTATFLASTPTPGPVTISYSTKIDGAATISNGDSIILGNLLTTQSNGNNPRGRFVAIRNMTTRSVYAGTYSGLTNAAATNTGETIPAKLAFTVSTSGLIRGTYARTATGTPIRPLVGTIDASGKATLIALSEEENPVGSGTYTLVVTTLTGQGATTGGVKISGSLVRTGTSAVNASGTFTATRTSTSTD